MSLPQPTTVAAGLHARLQRELESSAPFREDAALSAELTREAEPVVDALIRYSTQGADGLDHEGLTLLGLLGRRAGLLGATPSAVLSLGRALSRVLESFGHSLEEVALGELNMALLEGYVAGHEERVVQRLSQQLAQANTAIEIAPRVVSLVVVAPFEHPVLENVFAESERALLRCDARALLISLRHVGAQDEALARLLGSLCLTAESLGVRSFIAEASEAWLARLARFEIELLLPADTPFQVAMRHALGAADLALRPSRRGWAAKWLRRLSSPRRV